MAVDGYLNFDTKVDTSGFENGTKKIEDEASKTADKVSDEKIVPSIDASSAEAELDSLNKRIIALQEVANELSVPDMSLFNDDGSYKNADAAMQDYKRLDKLDAVNSKLAALQKQKEELENPATVPVKADTKQAEDSIDKLKSQLKRLAKTVGAVFGIKKAISFGKESLENAAEVNAANSQMTQTFGQLQGAAEEAMRRVADASGIVQTRLQGVGTSIYAFARTSGMETSQALGMMEEALQVAADSAAYYDRSLEDTSETLKSFLKGNYANDAALGLSATETTRNAAANKLYGKSFQELSEAQKQLTLLQMVKDANDLSGATGQAARESEGWENVLGNLKETWKQFTAVLGQPILKVTTAAVQRLTSALASLTEKTQFALNALSSLTGWEFGADSSEAMSDNIAQSVENQNALTDAVDETAKAQEKSLAGFDKINTLSSKTAAAAETGASSSAAPAMAVPIKAETSDASRAVEDFVTKAKPLLGEIKDYFGDNFGGTFSYIYSGLVDETYELYNTVSGIFEDIKSLGPPLAEYFQTDFTDLLQTAFSVAGERILGLYDTFNMVFADIWNLAVFPCLSAFINDGLPIITQFQTESIKSLGVLWAEEKKIFDMLWKDAARPALSLIASMFADCMKSLKSFWDKWGHPLFEKIREALRVTGDLVIKLWNKFLKPLFDAVMDAARVLWQEHLRPLLDNILDLVGTLIDAALDIYNKCLAPIVGWIIDFFGPKIAYAIGVMVKAVGNYIGGMIDVLNHIVDVLKGIINFIAGVFTGDWKRAWNGIKQIFKGIWDAMVDIVKLPINLIIDLINGMTGAIEAAVNGIIDNLNELHWEVPDWVPGLGGMEFGFDISNIDIPEIPHLAQGTVVPANYGEFLAVLGDNKREAEVVSPISTIKEAVREAMNGSTGTPQMITVPITTYLYPNSAAFHREVIKVYSDDKRRKGG